MVFNKKGFSPTIMLIGFVFIAFIIVIVAGVIFYGLDLVDSSFNQIQFEIGDQSFNQTYQETLFVGIKTSMNMISMGALGIVLGMIFAMMLVGFALRTSKMWIILDIFIIIGAFIIGVYLSQTFNTLINSNSAFLDIYSNNVQFASTFILNLPIYVTIIGVLLMLVTYIATKRKEEPVIGIGGQ